MTPKLRWAILGTGNIARQFAEGVRASHRGELAAVGSRSEASAVKFAQDFGVRAAFGSYHKLVTAEGIDAVYNSLPNNLHHHWTIAALKAGKHVLCEKPIGINAKEAEEMFDAASANKRILVEAFMYRSHPQTLAVLEAVKAGAIGELRLIRTSFCFAASKIAGNIRFDPTLSGGSLMDIGCYCVSFSRLFAGGEPQTIQAIGRLHPTGVDEMAAGTFTFANGLLASFTCGMTLHADNTAHLCGTHGYIEIPIPWKPPADGATFIISSSVPPRMDSAPSNTPAPLPGSSHRDVRKLPATGHLYGIEADDFAATVLDGQPPRLSRADTVGNMRVLDELRRQVGLKY